MSSHVSLTLYILRSHISIIVSINEPHPASFNCQMYLFTTRVRGSTSMMLLLLLYTHSCQELRRHHA